MQSIEAFWRYWRDNEPAIVAAIDDGTLQEWAEPIGARVKAMGKELQWEFGPGREAAHYFCVASPSSLAGRARAERWLKGAPAVSEHFEFYAARPGQGYEPQMSVAFGEHEVTFSDFVFAMSPDEHRRRVAIDVWHPSFSSDQELGLRASYVCLDAVLGEDAVEAWIGAVNVVETAPEGGADFPALIAQVQAMRETAETFTILRGRDGEGGVVFVTARMGLKAQDCPEHDRHVEVVMKLEEPTEQGLTTNEEADQLNAAEDTLMDALGESAVYIGRETGEGERRLYFHADSEGEGLPTVLAWVEDQPWATEVKHHVDPEWSILQRW